MVETATKPRNWAIAGLLAILAPQISYLYVGRPLRAALTVALMAGMLSLFWIDLGGALATPLGFSALSAAGLAAIIFFVSDSVRLALREKSYRLKFYNSWWGYLLSYLAVVGLFFPLTLEPARDAMRVRAFSLPSASMEPTLQLGETFIADMSAYQNKPPQPGDIVLFRVHNGANATWVKRAVGATKGSIRLEKGVVYINENALPIAPAGSYSGPGTHIESVNVTRETIPGGKSYLTIHRAQASDSDTIPTVTVPADQYFVLGDFRDNSMDSRQPEGPGLILRSDILGKAVFVLWPSRWDRLFSRVD